MSGLNDVMVDESFPNIESGFSFENHRRNITLQASSVSFLSLFLCRRMVFQLLQLQRKQEQQFAVLYLMVELY